jgi:hypothetical protein
MAGGRVPQTFDGVPHPCGFQGAGFDFVLTFSLQLLTCALFPLAIRMLLPQRCDQLLMRTETSNMKPNEPSRTALMIARQRAAHQVLDHGAILHDPFAMKILREDEKDVLPFANEHALGSIGRMLSTLSTNLPARSIGHRCVDERGLWFQSWC